MKAAPTPLICPNCGTAWELEPHEANLQQFKCEECGRIFNTANARFQASESLVEGMEARYADVQRTASKTHTAGKIVKLFGYAGAGILFWRAVAIVLNLKAADLSSQCKALAMGAACAALEALLFWVIGTFIQAVARNLLASGEIAVATSPLLSRADVKRILKIRRAGP